MTKHHLCDNPKVTPPNVTVPLTPSEQAGITIEGNNKWLTLMKTALWYKKAQVDK